MPYQPTGGKPGRPRKKPSPLEAPPPLKSRQWKALEYELDNPGASLRGVAKHAGTSHTAIAKWRKDADYMRGAAYVMAKLLESHLAAGDEKAKEEETAALPRRLRMSRHSAVRDGLLNLLVFLKANWTGPVKCMQDGEIYRDAESYVEHLRQRNAVWVGDLSEELLSTGKKK
jgi:hypothetical protein